LETLLHPDVRELEAWLISMASDSSCPVLQPSIVRDEGMIIYSPAPKSQSDSVMVEKPKVRSH